MKLVQLTMTESEFTMLSASMALQYHFIYSNKYSKLLIKNELDELSANLLLIITDYPSESFENLCDKIKRLTDEIDSVR